MPPRISLPRLASALPVRAKPTTCLYQCERLAPLQLRHRRTFADEKKSQLPLSETGEGPNENQLPHVSEEAETMAKITGKEGPAVNDQGTPIEDVVRGDPEAQAKLPKVMQEGLKANPHNSNTPSGSRSFSTSSRQRALEMATQGSTDVAPPPGVKFGLPSLPLGPRENMKYREDPIVEQVTNLIMQHGEKATAQRNMALILQQLRTSPPPTINPQRPLLPGSPPPSHLPLNPILYLTLAIDSVAPLLRIRSQRGAAGGGVALQIPVPLSQRQRRRTAVEWILAAARKRTGIGGGKDGFAMRVAQELIAAVEGRSAAWERRMGVHRIAVSARANLSGRRR